MPGSLKKLDDRVLGSKGRHDADAGDGGVHPEADGRGERTETVRVEREPARRPGNGDGVPSFLAVVWRVSKLVLVALGLVVLLAAALVLLPANEDNVIVRNVLSLGQWAAGPFRDVLTVDDPDRMRVYNYGIGALAYFVAAALVGRLPTGASRTR